jgi:hypothetical protein
MSVKILGIDIFRVDTVAQHELGLIVDDVRGGQGGPITIKQFIDDPLPIIKEFSPDGKYKYVRASTAITIGDSVRIDTGATDEPGACAPVTATDQPIEGVAVIAIPLNSFGFIQVGGRVPSQAAGTATAALRYGAKMAAAGAASDMKGSSTTGNMATLSSADATDATAQGRTIIQLDAAIDDGSTTQFRGEVYIY